MNHLSQKKIENDYVSEYLQGDHCIKVTNRYINICRVEVESGSYLIISFKQSRKYFLIYCYNPSRRPGICVGLLVRIVPLITQNAMNHVFLETFYVSRG